ncbi:MAG: hypothetical protein D6734_05365, partial [Candidatus Schekmanbacteria bacterium]
MNRLLSGNNIYIPLFFLFAAIVSLVIVFLPANQSLFIGAAFFIIIVSFISNEIALYFVIFSMLLSPEITITTLGSGDIELGRTVVIRFEDILLLLLGLSWFTKTAIYKEIGLIAKTPLNKPIFYYIGVCVLSTIFGIFRNDVSVMSGFFYVLKYFEYYVIYFIVVNNIDNLKDIKKILYAVFSTCIIICIYGLYQIPAGKRVSAPFEGETGEPNTLGGYLLILFFISAGIFLFSKRWKEKGITLFLMGIIFLPFVYTLSRSSYLAFIPASCIILYYVRKRIAVVATALLIIILMPFFLPKPAYERVEYTFKQPPQAKQLKIAGMRIDTSTSERINAWLESGKDFIKHPFFGYGITGYKFRDAQYVRILMETGIIGLIAFIYLLYSLYKESLRILPKLSLCWCKGLIIGYIAVITALATHSIGANTFIIIRIM